MWTNQDFQTIFAFMETIKAAIENPHLVTECKDVLLDGHNQALQSLRRIADSN